MTYYHVYVHYKDEKGKAQRFIEYNSSKEAVEKHIAIPYMKNKPFLLAGKVMYPPTLSQIVIFKSERPADEYTLPNGNTLKKENDVFYVAKCFASELEGVYCCNDEFITSPPEDEIEKTRTPTITVSKKTRVFIVHGRDETEALRLQKYLMKTLNLDAEIFEDFKKRSGSKTIIEQLEYIHNSVGYAFVIVTPDDLGCLLEDIDKCRTKFMIGKEKIKVDTVCKILDKLNSRARQNVVFEHGLFIGALGRDRVCCLLQEGTEEKPSDIDGILYEGFKKSVREKFTEITEKLKNINLVKI